MILSLTHCFISRHIKYQRMPSLYMCRDQVTRFKVTTVYRLFTFGNWFDYKALRLYCSEWVDEFTEPDVKKLLEPIDFTIITPLFALRYQVEVTIGI